MKQQPWKSSPNGAPNTMPKSENARTKLNETDVPADLRRVADRKEEPKAVARANFPYPKVIKVVLFSVTFFLYTD
jgi:hypothetical protein